MTIFRVQKDKNHPYVILNKSFLEDPLISLKLKGFLAYCLAKPDDWKFRIRQLASVLKEGKDALYAIVDEGVEHGYIKREDQKKGGKFHSTNYAVHETKIKINSTVSGFPDAELPDAETQTLLINDIPSNEKETPPTPSKGGCVRVGKFVQLTEEEMSSLNTQYGKEQVTQIIEEINDYLASTGRKPYKDYAATIRNWIRRRKTTAPQGASFYNKNISIQNKEWASKIVSALKHKDIDLLPDALIIINHGNGGDFVVKYADNGFKEQVLNRLRKMNIDVNGL